MNDVPILLMSGDERGPNEVRGTLEWSDEIFAASDNPDTRILKYKTVTHDNGNIDYHRITENMVVDCFLKIVPAAK